ncbi:conserved Plasmodium protein, unknown function [Plasmodium knowlesi strain H]|uniref:Uncharacterized protein n=3 Tax=Plasmodium knowlesi TaxID=5850 RepID=A0A5K1VCZ6_PLAKH|nr:conserved Plasmodium protein, unknown function [Plasmodium knowlesi strain H]OTN65238.1 Uncharacterized protein PKNOH_S120121300 [Plasmodium knowlesi]CAA9988079.1 conserved Plasmodium protein, unknown function [Plasmodium knowlesi strain H]SBO19939.1 conserved Plasmodium protein, unknown function [Plasmodium knowlesi strain H]SBO29083.1 conserved Plasmodium protein, unknown function [Plasmodium knowlesi strain H]VVS77553.1 conserved Plasmodium protein, unknown function [Plasmodium knowlesi |eukprot:XP_002259053.1 hypothetical protein, conserved in Plasmodium species [Plasmodium knowlesi strain H]
MTVVRKLCSLLTALCLLEGGVFAAEDVKPKQVIVTYTNANGFKSELKNFQYIFLNENDDSYYVKSSEIGELEIGDNIYFYKSFTKVINYFKYRIPTNIHFVFGYNDGDLILLKNNKKGVICKINNLFYSESGIKYMDRKNELYVKNDPFYIKKFNNYGFDDDDEEDEVDEQFDDAGHMGYNRRLDDNDDYEDYDDEFVKRAAICSVTGANSTFMPRKFLCYPSRRNNNELKAIFLKDEEYNKQFQLSLTYMNKDNDILLKKIASYFNMLLKLDFDKINIAYYIYNKTIACNFKYHMQKVLKKKGKKQLEDKYLTYNDEQVRSNNDFLYNTTPHYKDHLGDNNILWKHSNKNVTETSSEKCHKVFFNENEFNNCYKNDNYVYEMSLFKDNSIKKIKKAQVKNLSSLGRYIAMYYHGNDYVSILKDFTTYVYFRIKNLLDLVLFEDEENEVGFYYISFDKGKQLVHLFRCGLNSYQLNCREISFIPYEHVYSDVEPKVYLSTVQSDDLSTVFISTKTKLWKLYKDKDGSYNRKIMDSVKNGSEEYFGHINCYIVQTTYEWKLLYKYLKNITNVEENIVACSYFKHFTDSENSLLISFIENRHFIQRTYHVVRNKDFIISSGKTKLTIQVNELFDILMLFFIILCVIISVYTIVRILFTNKTKVGKMKHHFFDDTKNSFASTVD